MSAQYRHNHYVPEWYQKKFLLAGQKNHELFYLDLKLEPFIDPTGTLRLHRNPSREALKKCFAQRDLYTTSLGGFDSTEIEQHFFGPIDRRGHEAVDYYESFSYPWDGKNALQELMMYMSTQKLRTPKGLGWLAERAKTTDKNLVLTQMLRLQQLHCTIWTECVWLIADASQSDTKFIVSDHPVTVYNRRSGPRSQWCRGTNDPDIWLNGTQTIFPLSSDKILILTNLSWVRNPYQSATDRRPNPRPFRETIARVNDIQIMRHLSEQEVRETNFIIKSRAHRYIAAAKKEWLYPDEYVSKSHWDRYGDGYLFMPDPRAVHMGGEIIIGYRDGTSAAYDEYGRRPWDKGFRQRDNCEWNTLQRFQGEFAALYGPYRRGRAFSINSIDNERDDEEFHNYHLGLNRTHRKRPIVKTN